MKIRERFRRFMLRMFGGVPYEELEQREKEWSEMCCEWEKTEKELLSQLKEKNSTVANIIKTGPLMPVKVKTTKVIEDREIIPLIIENRVEEEVAKDFLPAVKDCMYVRVDNGMHDYTITAELWLYPIREGAER